MQEMGRLSLPAIWNFLCHTLVSKPWRLLMVLSAEKWASPYLDPDVTAGPPVEGQAGAPSALQGWMEKSGLSTWPGFSKEEEGARVSSRCEEGGPRQDQQNGGQARPAWRPRVPCHVYAPVC